MFDGPAPDGVASVAAIVASTPRPAKLQEAERELAELKARRAALAGEIARLAALPDAPGAPRGGASIAVLSAEAAALGDRIAPLRVSAVALRQAHAARLREALSGAIAAAAGRAADALNELQDALDVLTAADRALAQCGHEGLAVHPPDFAGLAYRLARLAGRG